MRLDVVEMRSLEDAGPSARRLAECRGRKRTQTQQQMHLASWLAQRLMGAVQCRAVQGSAGQHTIQSGAETGHARHRVADDGDGRQAEAVRLRGSGGAVAGTAAGASESGQGPPHSQLHTHAQISHKTRNSLLSTPPCLPFPTATRTQRSQSGCWWCRCMAKATGTWAAHTVAHPTPGDALGA